MITYTRMPKPLRSNGSLVSVDAVGEFFFQFVHTQHANVLQSTRKKCSCFYECSFSDPHNWLNWLFRVLFMSYTSCDDNFYKFSLVFSAKSSPLLLLSLEFLYTVRRTKIRFVLIR